MEHVVDTDKFAQSNFSTLGLDSNILKLVNSLEKDDFNLIFLTDNKNHLTGFVSLEQVLKNGPNEVALKKIQTKLPLLRDFNIQKIIKCYLDKNPLLIPLVDQKESITTVYNIFKIAKDQLFDQEFESEHILEKIPFTVQKNEKIDHVMAEIKKNFLEKIVVEDQGNFLGYINSRNLANLLIKPEGLSRGEKKGEKLKFEGTIEDLITEDDKIVIEEKEVFNALDLIEIMEQNNSPLIFVRNKQNELVGMIKLKKMFILANDSIKGKKISINISVLSAPDENIEQIARKKLMTLIERYSPFFNVGDESEATVKFHKIENQSQKGMFKYETDIRVSFGRGKDSIFTVKSDDWGSEKSLNKAYSKVSRLISDKRKISKDIYQKKEVLE